MKPHPKAKPNIFNCDTIYPAVKEYIAVCVCVSVSVFISIIYI